MFHSLVDLFNVIFTKSRLLDYDIQLNKPQIIGFIKLSNNKLKTGCSVKKMNCSSVKKNSVIVFVTNSHSKVGNEI